MMQDAFGVEIPDEIAKGRSKRSRAKPRVRPSTDVALRHSTVGAIPRSAKPRSLKGLAVAGAAGLTAAGAAAGAAAVHRRKDSVGKGAFLEDVDKALGSVLQGTMQAGRATGGFTARKAGAGAAAIRNFKATVPGRIGNATQGATHRVRPAGEGQGAVRRAIEGPKGVVRSTANSGSGNNAVRQAREAITTRRRARNYLVAGGAAAGAAGLGGAAYGASRKD